MRRFVFLLLVALLTSACGAAAGPSSAAGASIERPFAEAVDPTVGEEESTSASDPSYAELAAPAGSALLQSPAESPAEPVSITIDSLDIGGAPVVPVGVESNGEMEIPGAEEVGWYRYGPTPGESGSAVLAAHIAYNGRDGVFRRLADIDVGARVTVVYDDDTISRFEVIEVGQYGKDAVPFDRVFAKEGSPELALVTCGGDFNRSLRTYEDNFIAYAVPIDA